MIHVACPTGKLCKATPWARWRLSDSWFLGHCERILHVSVHLLEMMDCPAPLVFGIFTTECSTFVFADKPNLWNCFFFSQLRQMYRVFLSQVCAGAFMLEEALKDIWVFIMSQTDVFLSASADKGCPWVHHRCTMWLYYVEQPQTDEKQEFQHDQTFVCHHPE